MAMIRKAEQQVMSAVGVQLAWIALHVVLVLIARRCVDPSRPTTGKSPRATYMQGMLVQVAFGPIMWLAFATWRENNPQQSVTDWMATSMHADSADTLYSRVFYANLLAHFAKDFIFGMDPLIIIHHIVCIGGMSLQTYVIVEGANAMLLGSAILELGSAAYNLVNLYPSSRLCLWLYVVTMAMSNLGAAWTAWVWLQLPGHPPGVDVGVTLVMALLIGMRQKVAMNIFSVRRAPLATSAGKAKRSS
jgi:hypothetical protein